MAMVSSQSSSRSSGSRTTTITTYECNICYETFNSRSQAEAHIRQEHTELFQDSYVCQKCSESFGSKKDVEEHFKKKHPEIFKDAFVCSLCKKQFSTKKEAEAHLRTKHPKRKTEALRCPVCGAKFKQSDLTQVLEHLMKQHPKEFEKFAEVAGLDNTPGGSGHSKPKRWWKFWGN